MTTPKATIGQMRAGRALLGWTQQDLAANSGLSLSAIQRIEIAKFKGRPDTIQQIVATLESAGIIFIPENGEGRGVRLRKTRW